MEILRSIASKKISDAAQRTYNVAEASGAYSLASGNAEFKELACRRKPLNHRVRVAFFCFYLRERLFKRIVYRHFRQLNIPSRALGIYVVPRPTAEASARKGGGSNATAAIKKPKGFPEILY